LMMSKDRNRCRDRDCLKNQNFNKVNLNI
jgi:hypothetical protein